MFSSRSIVKSRFFKGLCVLLKCVNYWEYFKYFLICFDSVCCRRLCFVVMNYSVFDPVLQTIVPIRPVRRSVYWDLDPFNSILCLEFTKKHYKQWCQTHGQNTPSWLISTNPVGFQGLSQIRLPVQTFLYVLCTTISILSTLTTRNKT